MQNTYFKDYEKGAACLGLSQMGGAFLVFPNFVQYPVNLHLQEVG